MPCNTHDISEFETPVMDKFVPGCKKVSLGKGPSINDVGNFSGFLTLFFLEYSFWPEFYKKCQKLPGHAFLNFCNF